MADCGVGDGDVGDGDGVVGWVVRGDCDYLHYNAIRGGYGNGGIQVGGSEGEYADVGGCARGAVVGEVAGVIAIRVKGGG